uniref:S6 family peptidase n=1 Tax=Escherichia coli TaxID=562 RepID=UPI000B801DF4
MNKIYSLKFSAVTGGLIAVSELARKVTQKSCRKLSLAGLTTLALTLSSSALAATVRADIPYQTFRDFAENKGSFFVGNTNIAIKNDTGNIIGYLDKAPMPDFSSASVAATLLVPGEHTLYSPEYVVTAKHVNGSNSVTTNISFGYKQNEYSVVAGYNHPSSLADIKTLRLNKLVTEVAPAIVSTSGTVNNAYNKDSIYTAFYRLGGGDKNRKNINGTSTHVDGDFLIGGTIGYLSSYNNNLMISSGTAQLFNEDYQGYLANYLIPGDSGSPLFGYNSKTKEWELIGVTSSMTVNGNNWAVTSRDFLSQQPKNDFDQIIKHDNTSTALTWTYASNTNTGEIKNEKYSYLMHSGKNLYFTGDNGHIDLQSSVNQGAGYLQFTDSYTISTDNGSTWIGGGIIVEDGATVNWGINGVKGDNLHKVGSGTLIINGTGENQGGLKVGDGTVILDQHADKDNKVQAASSLDISSGRATVKLTNAEQINPDNIFWGYRGGKLDLNSADLTFSRLNAVDYGAEIINSNSNKSILTLNLLVLKPEDISVNIKNFDFMGGNGAPGDLFYNKDYKRYYILKGTRYSPFYSDRNNNNIWTDAGANRESAIKLYKDNKIKTSAKPYMYHGQFNGNMDIIIPSLSGENTFSLDGSVNISGDIDKNTGALIFQGHPVIHAGQTVSASQEDWENRQFTMDTLKLDNADFHLSRNASMNADIEARNNSTVTLGSDLVYTDTNDGTGYTISSVKGNSVPTKEHDFTKFHGGITAENSTIKVANNADVNVTEVSFLDNSPFNIDKGAKVTVRNTLFTTSEINSGGDITFTGIMNDGKYISPSIHFANGGYNLTDDSSTFSAKHLVSVNGDISSKYKATINLGQSETEHISDRLLLDGFDTSYQGKITANFATLNMDNALWSMNGTSVLHNINAKDSMIRFTGSNNIFSTLTVDALTANNSAFIMRTDLKNSDKLIVTSKMEGTNNNLLVEFTQRNGNYNNLNIELVNAPIGTNTKFFNPQSQTIGFSDVTPVIATNIGNGNTTWTLAGFEVKANPQSTKIAQNYLSTGYKAFLAEVNNLNKRMGDLRDINGEAGAW